MKDRREQVSVRIVSSIDQIDRERWDACAGDEDPFVSYAFLHALEASGSATAETGWLPQHLAIEGDDGLLLGVAPVYLKGHSYGEYVFDWSWASAYRRAGLSYYPKLQCAVPFSPVTGQRLLAAPGSGDQARRWLVAGMLELGRHHEASSVHVTFLTAPEYELCGEMGLLQREGIQFHWHNQGYATFDDFLDALMARKRKAIKKERQRARQDGIRLSILRGDDIKARHWDAFHRFYLSTIDRKWASAYLEKDFFHRIGSTMGERVVLVAGERDGELVAGALNLLGKRALYGRYWGCRGDHRFLHFEACYHQAIELAIELGLERVEAGAQGPHKLQRGYLPERTYSAHFVAHPEFRAVIGDFVARERLAVAAEIDAVLADSPYRADRAHGRADERAAPKRR